MKLNASTKRRNISERIFLLSKQKREIGSEACFVRLGVLDHIKDSKERLQNQLDVQGLFRSDGYASKIFNLKVSKKKKSSERCIWL